MGLATSAASEKKKKKKTPPEDGRVGFKIQTFMAVVEDLSYH